jgi:uncharacterized membrane protein
MGSFKADIIQIIPNLMNGLLVIFIGFAIAYLLKWSSSFVVRLVLNSIPKSISDKEIIKDEFTGIVIGTGRLLFILTIYLSLTTGFKRMGLIIVSEWMQELTRFLPNILGAFLILYIGWKSKGLIAAFIFKSLNETEYVYSKLTSQVLSWIIFTTCFLIALEQLGININIILTVITVLLGVAAGGVSLTFALGSKATISDILYCYQLHKYYEVGQEIKILDVNGTIKSIGPTFVSVETIDGDVTIPGNVFNREVTLLSRKRNKI